MRLNCKDINISVYQPVRHRVVEDAQCARCLLGRYCGGVCEVEVALTILKLTGTDKRASSGVSEAGRAQVSIGMHAHPKIDL